MSAETVCLLRVLWLTEPFPPTVRRHPEQIDGSFYIRQDWDDKGWSVMYEDESLAHGFAVGPPTEFVSRTNASQIRFALPR